VPARLKVITHEPRCSKKKVGLLGVLIALVISVGGLVEIVPLFFQASVSPSRPRESKPARRLRLEGRDIYVREGCYLCHSQMIRPFRSETEPLRSYSLPGESVYGRPFQFGSKRTGPDLARVGGRYSDDCTACTCSTRVTSCRNRTCRASRGWPTAESTRNHREKMEARAQARRAYTDADIAGAAAASRQVGARRAHRLPAGPRTNLKTGKT